MNNPEPQSQGHVSTQKNLAASSLQELRVRVAAIVGETEVIEFPDGHIMIERKDWPWKTHFNAKIVGWERGTECRDFGSVPDYCNDLNACASFEEMLTHEQQSVYSDTLSQFWLSGRNDNWRGVHATAEQRCRAFVAVMEAPSVSSGVGSTKTTKNLEIPGGV